MKKMLAVALALFLPLAAEATCTWTTNADDTSGKVVCTTVGETAIAGAGSALLGWQLSYCPKGVVLSLIHI